MLARATVTVLVVLSLVACENTPAPVDAAIDPPDMGMPDVGHDAGPPAPDFCAEMSIPRIPFATSVGGDRFGDLAGDFTVHTSDGGTWNFRDQWTGCESYVFFVNLPGFNDALFATELDELFTRGPRNVQYFFLSDGIDDAARQAFAAQEQGKLDEAFAFESTSAEDQAFWRTRFHFVTDAAEQIDGSVGAMLTAYIAYARMGSSAVDVGGGRGSAYPPAPSVFGIDRAQHWDAGDSLAQFVAATDNSILGMASFLGDFYNYRAALESRLASEAPTTTIVSLVDMTTATRVFTPTVTLPDATTMAGFDSLEIDAVVDCQAQNPFACSEWDRIADVQYCVDGAACTDRREIGRWITPYWRRGRQHYALDASAFLGLLRTGGSTTFFVELGPDWERATEWHASVSLRFRHVGGVPSPASAERAFTGGTFDANYNTSHTPYTFTPPTGTTRVELVTLLTGHGQDGTTNCSEWCDHRHTFSINGTALPTIRHTGAIGSGTGCADRARDGVIPGQLGNWAPERAYWCPGLAVEPIRTDITSMVTVGSPNTVGYVANFGASSPPGGGDIDLSTYVVYYR
jgi:hypothetical protein